MDENRTPWGGRFTKPMDAFITEFGASLPVDRRMWEQDIQGSVAHAKMLEAQGVISKEDLEAIELGLSEIHGQIEAGDFEYRASDEDIHMAIERALIERVGDAGRRLHTARSRNDQVALDTRMYAKEAALRLAEGANALRAALLRRADEQTGVIMPGYTHLQKAQPVLFSHHLLAYTWMLARDVTRLRAAYAAADIMPLGSAALAGTTFPVDRAAVAAELGFAGVTPNSMDAVSDRDFLLDLTYACCAMMVHLSRFAEEIVLFSTEEFGFLVLDDAFATGSSIMPQKKNPDFAELVRGKTGRVVGDLTALLVTMKGLPLAYNKDMQEDKEAAFDAIDTAAGCLRAMEGMVSTLRVNADRMRDGALGGHMAATDLADHLVERGMPFRDAHEVVGRLVLRCEAAGKRLQDLTFEELAEASPEFGPEAPDVVEITSVVARRTSEGGTAPGAVAKQLEKARVALVSDEEWARSAARP